MNDLLDAALDYAGRGWSVFPCDTQKRPKTPNGFLDASTDAATVRAWWEKSPASTIGIATGGVFVVVDVDVKKGALGDDSWAALRHELRDADLEDTAIAETPSGGFHVYYRANGHKVGSSAGKLAEGIDVRAEGGYVIAPPSRNGNGNGWEWAEGHDLECLRDLPEALVERLAYTTKKRTVDTSVSTTIPQGKRNATLMSFAGTMQRPGMTQKAIEAALLKTNAEQCQPPLPEDEVRAIAASVARYEPAATDVAPTPVRRARVVCVANVPAVAVTWLWPGRLPEGKISLLIGDPGMGKTMLALDIIARVTRGGTFPDGSRAPAGDAVILTAEDGIADTIRPRLDAAGADVSRVWVLKSVTADNGNDKLFSLADDVDVLDAVVTEKQARLVMIDPLDAYLRGVDSHRNSEVRAVLAPWAALLERTNATGLGVHHLNKDTNTVNALYRAGGSLAFVAAARAVFGVAPDPDDEDRKLFLPVKLNIAAKPPGIGYRITDGGIEWDSDPVTCDAAKAFGGTKRADSDLVSAAKEFLRDALGDGQPVAQLLIEESASERGISAKCLQNAKKSLGVRSKREGFGPGGLWYWQLSPNR